MNRLFSISFKIIPGLYPDWTVERAEKGLVKRKAEKNQVLTGKIEMEAENNSLDRNIF